MTKSTCERRNLNGGLSIPEGQFLTTRVKNMAADGQLWHWCSSREVISDPQILGIGG